MRRLLALAALVASVACASPEREDEVGGEAAGAGGTSAAGGAGAGGATAGIAGSGGVAASSGVAGSSSMVCTPGQQIACACPGGADGAQACRLDGSGYDPCVCPMGAGGSGTAGTAGSGTAGTGTAGTGTAGTGTAGTGTAGTGTAGTGTAGTGTAGTGTAGTGTAGSGTGGSGPLSGADTCPGAELPVTAGGTTVTGTTAGAGGDYDPVGCASAASSDVVYHFVAPVTGNATVVVTPTKFDAVVYYAAGTCTSTPKKCAASGGGYGEPESLTFAVTAGQSYWVFVDGWTQGFAGDFTLSLTF